MIRLSNVRRNVARMMGQFPSHTATLLRPERDAYGQPTDVLETVGTVRCWMEAVNRPRHWKVDVSGARYDDEGAIWACLLWSEDMPQARHEDIVELDDGRKFSVKNVQNDANLRVYWQLADRGG